jgi:hypothetical protein
MPASRKARGDGKMKTVVSGQWSVVSGQCETASGFLHPSSFIPHPSAKAVNELPTPLCPLPTAHRPLHTSSLILHPSSFPLQPTTYHLQPTAPRPGISLLEVLIAIFILSIGLLGVAALIPLGQMSLWETAKADRSGACGRAAMREIQVRRMLDFRFWYWSPSIPPNPAFPGNYWGFYPPYATANTIPDTYADVTAGINLDSMPFVIDPLGRAKGLPETFGQYPTTMPPTLFLPRRTLRSIPLMPNQPIPPPAITTALAEQIFIWNDDLPFDAPKNSTTRPTLVTSSSGNVISEGSYSWFFSATPAATEMSRPVAQRRWFNVSVAVCYKRNFDPNAVNTPDGEHTATINSNNVVTPKVPGFPGMGIGGGMVILANSSLPNSPKVNVKENQWVMLYHLDPVPQLNRCLWYRVINFGTTTDASNNTHTTLSLIGPDWDPNLEATLVVVPGVIGVYNTTMELDWDLLR